MSQLGSRRPRVRGRWVMLLPHRERKRRLVNAANEMRYSDEQF